MPKKRCLGTSLKEITYWRHVYFLRYRSVSFYYSHQKHPRTMILVPRRTLFSFVLSLCLRVIPVPFFCFAQTNTHDFNIKFHAFIHTKFAHSQFTYLMSPEQKKFLPKG